MYCFDCLSMANTNFPCARHSFVSSVNYRVHRDRARRNFQIEGSFRRLANAILILLLANTVLHKRAMLLIF